MTDSDQLHRTLLFKFNDFNICLNYIRMISYDIQYLGTYMCLNRIRHQIGAKQNSNN